MPSIDHLANSFTHIGLLYQGQDEYVRGCQSFLAPALTVEDPVLVAVPGDNGDLLRDSIRGSDVEFADMSQSGRNPGRIIPWVLLSFLRRHTGRRVWMIGEPIWPGRTELEYPACVTHEALVNEAFAEQDAAILCLYDAARLQQEAINDAACTHPTLANVSATWPSPDYPGGLRAAARFNRPLPEPPPHAQRYAFSSVEDLSDLRYAAAHTAHDIGMTPDRVGQLQLIVNELASNSLEHTAAGHGVLRIWAGPGLIACQIDDFGKLADPMAGQIPPSNGALRGRGLALVNQFADLVRIHTHAEGTSIRIELLASVDGGRC